MKTAAFSAAELRFGLDTPGPRICRTFTRKGAAVSSQGLPEIAGPLGGRPKADHAAGSFAQRSTKADRAARTSPRRSAKADCAARTSPRRSAKADHAARTFSRRSAKADNGGRLCPGGAFWPRGRPRRRRKRFASLYRAEKPVFTKRRRLGDGKSFFVRRFVSCFFARPERNWRCRRGKSPPPRNPGRPAAAPPNDRDRLPVFAPPAQTPAPATPPQSARSRRLSGCPQRPNLSARRRAESPKGKRKGGTPDETRTAALTTAPPEDGWEGSQPKRPQRRGKPAKQPRRSAS